MRPIVYTVPQADVDAGHSPPMPVDYNRDTGQYSLQYLAAAGAGTPGTGAVQLSYDDPFNPPGTGMAWYDINLVGGTASLNQAVRAFRINTPVLGDVLTIVAQGASPAG